MPKKASYSEDYKKGVFTGCRLGQTTTLYKLHKKISELQKETQEAGGHAAFLAYSKVLSIIKQLENEL